MNEYLKCIKQHADYSERVMETGDHFKNGASPKSQMSRGNCLFILLLAVFLSSCGAQLLEVQGGRGNAFDKEKNRSVATIVEIDGCTGVTSTLKIKFIQA
jgi:hypothetical protein